VLFRRLGAGAANTALVAGCTFLVLGYFVAPFSEWAKQVHNHHFLGIVFAALMLFQFSMSRIAPRPDPWVQQSSGDVDPTP